MSRRRASTRQGFGVAMPTVHVAALATALAAGITVAAAAISPAPARAGTPDWNRVENIKQAARQIGDIQVQGGVEQALKFISACYQTHGLASKYSKAFEGCIAQDYIVSQTLASIYERVPPETLEKSGAPSVAAIAQSFRARSQAAFGQYQRPTEDAAAVLRAAHDHGMPVFLGIVFPASSKPQAK